MLRRNLLRIAADLPAGDPTRRKLLAALSRTGSLWAEKFVDSLDIDTLAFGITLGGFTDRAIPYAKLMPRMHEAEKEVLAGARAFMAAMQQVAAKNGQRVSLVLGDLTVQQQRSTLVFAVSVEGVRLGVGGGGNAYVYEEDEDDPYMEEVARVATAVLKGYIRG